jgi:hypothetical protein
VLDFVADCRESVAFDSFHWAPRVNMVSKAPADLAAEWSASSDFSGPLRLIEKRSLSPWEKYAQVLLLANELVFVD